MPSWSRSPELNTADASLCYDIRYCAIAALCAGRADPLHKSTMIISPSLLLALSFGIHFSRILGGTVYYPSIPPRGNGINVEFPARGDGNCTFAYTIIYDSYQVNLRDYDATLNSKGCGRGLLANLHGLMLMPTMWTCGYDRTGLVAESRFNLVIGQEPYVQMAIWMATAGQVVTHCD